MRSIHAIGIAAAVFLLPQAGFGMEARELFKAADPSIVVIFVADRANKDLGLGSGVLIAPREVVTSCHVLEGAARITVKQANVQRNARLRFEDTARDLCQIQLEDTFPTARPVAGYVMSKDLEVGQQVFAIGSPQGLEHSLSRGIVSALRPMKGNAGHLIQTDAAVSPGSSGGGLFDAEARLIGIITFQFTEGQNLNFAIPADWIGELASRNPDRVAAAGSVETGEKQAASDNRWHPSAGDRWRYRLLHGQRAVGAISVEIVESGGGKVRERITKEGSPGFSFERTVPPEFAPRAFLPTVMLPGGYQLFELSPYFPPGSALSSGDSLGQIPGDVHLPATPKQTMLWKTRVTGLERVRVPAGEFEAWKIESVAGRNTPWGSVKVTGLYWYSGAMRRTVKMTLIADVSISADSSTETYELTAFEGAK
jgi:serine protease Do